MNTVLHSRLRVLRHSYDPRRNKRCREALRAGQAPTMSVEDLEQWEASDRLARASARKEGRIHPQAVKTARRASGIRCGRLAVA